MNQNSLPYSQKLPNDELSYLSPSERIHQASSDGCERPRYAGVLVRNSYAVGLAEDSHIETAAVAAHR